MVDDGAGRAAGVMSLVVGREHDDRAGVPESVEPCDHRGSGPPNRVGDRERWPTERGSSYRTKGVRSCYKGATTTGEVGGTYDLRALRSGFRADGAVLPGGDCGLGAGRVRRHHDGPARWRSGRSRGPRTRIVRVPDDVADDGSGVLARETAPLRERFLEQPYPRRDGHRRAGIGGQRRHVRT